jgi:hypothetical protein
MSGASGGWPSSAADRLLWVWLSRIWAGWRLALRIVKPETVIAWHRKGSPDSAAARKEGDSRGSIKMLNINRLKKEYPGFEFTSLRQQVSTAEKFCYLVREIREKGRIFTTFATQTGPEKVNAATRCS